MQTTHHALEYLGTAWGGWWIAPTLVRNNSTVLSFGLAHDISFDLEILKRFPTVKIIGIDPTPISERTVAQIPFELKNRYKYVPLALSGKYGVINIDSVGYKSMPLGGFMNEEEDYSVLKMDIEGFEYEVFDSISEMKFDQVCVEWHHWLDNKYTINDTMFFINKIRKMGYEFAHYTNKENRQIQETLFIREDLI